MTDEQIVKALACCSINRTCCGCPLNNYDGESCIVKVKKEAHDLINRQKADIAKKDIEIDILIRKKETLNDEVFGLKAEVEQWKDKYQSLWCEPDTFLHRVKSRAIQEFAERLKAISHPYGDTQMVFELQIDNLVKEMTEGRKECDGK